MGFNATRRYRDGKSRDVVLLVAAVVVVVGMVLWAVGVIG